MIICLPAPKRMAASGWSVRSLPLNIALALLTGELSEIHHRVKDLQLHQHSNPVTGRSASKGVRLERKLTKATTTR